MKDLRRMRGPATCIMLALLLLMLPRVARGQSDADSTAISLQAFGKKYTLPMRQVSGLAFVPIDWRVKEVLQKYGAALEFDSSSNVLTVKRGDDTNVWKLGDKRIVGHDANGGDIQSDLLLQDEKPWIPLWGLTTLVPSKIIPGDVEGEFFLDPLITNITLLPDRSEHALHVDAAAPVSMKTMVLKEPDRFVVDISDACLDLEKFTTRSIDDPDLGQIRYGQFKPDVVRVVIPLQGDLEVEPLPQSTPQHLIMALRRGDVRVLGQNFKDQKITGVRIARGKNAVTLSLKLSGPMQYEWHRLRPPDNRIFVDIPQAVLKGKQQNFDIDDGWTGSIRVSQFQVKPRSVVRMVFTLDRPAAFEIKRGGSVPNELQLIVRQQDTPLDDDTLRGVGESSPATQGATVVIDPGHGGSDPGAINRSTGLQEKMVTLDISLRLAALMKKEGWNVFLTREVDQDVSYAGSSASEELGARVKVANDLKADLFVSIHCNANANQKQHGTSVHWFKASDWPLARAVMGQIANHVNGTVNRGAQFNRFYVLRHSAMPSVLVETAYITNPKEGAQLAQANYRQLQAKAIFEGLKTYVARYGNRRTVMRK